LKMKLFAIACAFTAVTVVCPALALSADHTGDSLDTVEKNLGARKAVMVDVREDKETNEGYVDGAILVPLSLLTEGSKTDDFDQVLTQQIPAKSIVYIYCAAGQRCLAAADILTKFGYRVRPLRQGYDDLVREGFVTAKPRN